MNQSIATGAGDNYADDVAQKVIDIVIERAHADRAQVTPEARLYDLTDSLGVTEIVMDLEDELEGSMPDESVGTIQTVGQLIDYVRTHFPAPRPKDTTPP